MDICRFAREGGFLEGRVALAEFPRLEDLLARGEGEVFFRLQGGVDKAAGKRENMCLRVLVSGELSLVCQRCLAPVVVTLAIENCLELVGAEEASGQGAGQESLADETRDFLQVASGKTGFRSVVELVEDEILLALPYAPRHDDCALPDSDRAGMPHPFAALAALKSQSRS